MSEETNSEEEMATSPEKFPDNVFPLLGFVGFLGVVLLEILLGGNLVIFVNIPSIVMCVGGTLALSLMAFSYDDLAHVLVQIPRIIFPSRIPKESIHPADPEVLRGMIVYAYASAAIGLAIGAIQILGDWDELYSLSLAIKTSLLCPFYSLLGAEGILRPMAHHLERRLGE